MVSIQELSNKLVNTPTKIMLLFGDEIKKSLGQEFAFLPNDSCIILSSKKSIVVVSENCKKEINHLPMKFEKYFYKDENKFGSLVDEAICNLKIEYLVIYCAKEYMNHRIIRGVKLLLPSTKIRNLESYIP